MAANEFVNKLKASGGANDISDLASGYADYKRILARLPAIDRISFSLNVLCILCRNLDKVPSWRDVVSAKELLVLSIDCVRETRPAERPERVKTLACVCHIHKFVIRQNVSVSPELMLKLSYMPFEQAPELMLPEHAKTYWSILGDRVAYLEILKAEQRPVLKLLPKLVEDYDKVLRISDSVKFCQLVLVFLVKKLHHLFSDVHTVELNDSYRAIFEGFTAKSDLKNFKKLSDEETVDLYVKFSECFYIVMGNASKVKFRGSFFPVLVRACIVAVGHRPDLFHCLQTFYLNSFCNLLMEKPTSSFTETILSGLVISCEVTEKLSYRDAMMNTYPYIYQLLRLYMEHTLSNEAKWKEHFTVESQESCLKLVLFLMGKLRDTKQVLKCDGCTAKTGLHDALRISFPVKSVISTSLSQDMDLTGVLPVYLAIVEKQHEVLSELEAMPCRNHQKCLQKAQTDIHNMAILLHNTKNYAFSIQVFEVYLKREIALHSGPSDLRNIGRGFYNKAICELDSKLYEASLRSAYLSFLFSQPEGLSSEKHISLVIDIKAKEIKNRDPNASQDASQDRLQMLTVKDVYEQCVVTVLYGDLGRFFRNLRMSQLLRHEFVMYAKLWPSMVPIAGVWIALYDLVGNGLAAAFPAEESSAILEAMNEVVVQTPHVVRTIHNDHFRTITLALLARFDDETHKDPVESQEKATTGLFRDTFEKFERNLETRRRARSKADSSKSKEEEKPVILEENSAKLEETASKKSGKEVLMHVTLLFLKSEYDLAKASAKHGWKASNVSTELILASCRKIPDEHQALQAAARAVETVSSELRPLLELAPSSVVTSALRLWRHGVPLLLSMGRRAHAFQLAQAICQLADIQEDSESYLQAAGALLSRASSPLPALDAVLCRAGQIAERTVADGGGLEAALVFVCEAAIYRAACGSPGTAAKLVQYAQARILEAADTQPDLNLDLAVGRLLDAQIAMCTGAGPGAAVWAQRHYLTVANTATAWSARRLRSLYTHLRSTEAGLHASRRCRALLLWRRARSACCAALQHSGAVDTARLLATCVCAHRTDDTRAKIDDCLKYTLGLDPTSSTPSPQPNQPKPNLMLSARNEPLETMLDAQTFRRAQHSPPLPYTRVPAFQMPDFASHKEECTCYACETPFCFILACQTAGLEASMYFRAKEFDIARHYFDGAFTMFSLVEQKLQHAVKGYERLGFEGFVVKIVWRFYRREFLRIQVEILIEASFFELSEANYTRADELIVRIHELMQEAPDLDIYLRNEIMNLMCTSAYMRKIIKSPDSDETGLESELENLKLSPANAKQSVEIQRTPERKAEGPPKIDRTNEVVKDEEVPNLKRKFIKLNFDDAEKSTSTKPSRKARFKTPVPITSKPVPEIITPVPKAKAKPKILVTQPSLDLPSVEELATPMPRKRQEKSSAIPLDTPINEDVFFTPQTSVRTYAQKTLRKDLVKNLDREFATPKMQEKENATASGSRPQRARKKVETRSLRSLQRSTSPGNLDDNPLYKRVESPTRPKLKDENASAEEGRKK